MRLINLCVLNEETYFIKFIVTDGLSAKRTERSKRVSVYKFCLSYSRVSIKRPGLNFSKKFLVNDQYYLRKSQLYHVLFTYSIKHPGLDFWKKSLLHEQYRHAARVKNPGGQVVLGGDNVSHLVEIGLTDPPKFGRAAAPPASHLAASTIFSNRRSLEQPGLILGSIEFVNE